MGKFKVRATATVDVEVRVEARDEDEANDLALLIVKQIRCDANGGIAVPKDASIEWPASDMLEWYETYQEE